MQKLNHEEHEVEFDSLSNRVIGRAIEVHRLLGPGLLESTYEQRLAQELRLTGIKFQLEAALPVECKGIHLDCGYRIDLIIEKKLIVELKNVDSLLPIHEAQLLTYMKLAKISIGLFINFNTKLLRNGIRRFVL